MLFIAFLYIYKFTSETHLIESVPVTFYEMQIWLHSLFQNGCPTPDFFYLTNLLMDYEIRTSNEKLGCNGLGV